MKKSLQIDDFWKKYLDAVLKRSVPKDKAEWYLKWAQKFAVSAPGQTGLPTGTQATAEHCPTHR